MTTSIDNHRRLAIAPMMELTDRHYRYLARLLSRHTLLYTEMLTAAAVIHGDQSYLLGKHPVEGPVVLQLGGSDPAQMAEAAAIGEQWGYGEINMNVGCPSDRVKAGRFGACLMAEPELVKNVVEAMQRSVTIPVSVKCRLGIDRDDSYEALHQFVGTVAESGCRHFIVHARKAWLDGLSPKENRSIPPLRYEYVYRLKNAYPHLHITINGGIESLDSAQEHLRAVDGVMIGRAAYYHPALLADVDARLFADINPAVPTGTRGELSLIKASGSDPATASAALSETEVLSQIAMAYAHYMQDWMVQGVRLSAMSRHLVSLFQKVPGARQWRRHISEQANQSDSAITLVSDALSYVNDPQRRSA